MTEKEDGIDALIEAAAPVLGLEIDESKKPGIAMNLRNLRALYLAVEGYDEADAVEPLGVYRP